MTHLTWTPHEITAIDAPRTGFIGRAAAMLIDGIECIVLCRNEVDLANVGTLLCTQGFDIDTIYKATLVHSTGVQVVIPPVVPEVPAAPPVTPEMPVRLEDGQPVATYKAVEPEDDDEL